MLLFSVLAVFSLNVFAQCFSGPGLECYCSVFLRLFVGKLLFSVLAAVCWNAIA